MNKRQKTPLMRQLLSETKKCELCGCRRGLEVHHIIPVAFGGPENDIDNLIVVCTTCHSRLTPKKCLTKRGIEKVLPYVVVCRIYENFYRVLGERLDEWDVSVGPLDVCDVFDEIINHELILNEIRQNRQKKSDLKKYIN